jgi:hypothetical protein
LPFAFRNKSFTVSWRVVGNPETGKSESVKPDCASNLGTLYVKSHSLVSSVSGAEHCADDSAASFLFAILLRILQDLA